MLISAHGGGGTSDSIHGEFGRAIEWPVVRPKLEHWLASHRPAVEAILDALFAGADEELRQQRGDLLSYLVSDSLVAIDGAVDEPSPTEALSERLADVGLLPMFGFPTRIRTLYTNNPRRAFPWPPRNTIQRDDGIALSTWSPGSEVVKDRRIHRVVGVVEYKPQGQIAAPVADPLGPEKHLGHCANCATIDETEGEKSECPICGIPAADPDAGEPGYRRMTAVQPLGYRSDYARRDYRDWFEWSAGGSRPRMSAQPLARQERVHAALVDSGTARVFQINDNRGHDWRFAPQAKGHGWICVDAVEPGAGFYTQWLEEHERKVALLSSTVTDVLVIGADEEQLTPGLSLKPDASERRAAWYSLGFLLRGAASRLLEVQTNEIDVGLRAVTIAGSWQAQVFLSDSLANGAGYCTHLGDPDRFSELMADADAWGHELEKHPVGGKRCDSACYDCLKDYRNMSYHGLLDWRLGLGSTRLLAGRAFDPERRWHDLTETVTARFAAELGFSKETMGARTVLVLDDLAIVLTHPFESTDDDHMSEELADIKVDLAVEGTSTSFTNAFNLLRRPSRVYGEALRRHDRRRGLAVGQARQHVSPSAAADLLMCPLRLAFHTEGTGGPGWAGTPASRLGSACHAVLEQAARGALGSPDEPAAGVTPSTARGTRPSKRR